MMAGAIWPTGFAIWPTFEIQGVSALPHELASRALLKDSDQVFELASNDIAALEMYTPAATQTKLRD
jgi:hypothetical protein